MRIVADILYTTQSKLQPPQYYSHPALTRYFDHIQTRPSIRTSAEALTPAFSIVTFDLDNAPRPERTVEPPKKKEKAAKPADAEAAPVQEKSKAAPATADQVPAGEGKSQKKEKKEKKKDAAGAEKKAGGKAPAPEDSEPVPSMIDLRVGHIVDSESIQFCRMIIPELSSCSYETPRCRRLIRRGKPDLLLELRLAQMCI